MSSTAEECFFMITAETTMQTMPHKQAPGGVSVLSVRPNMTKVSQRTFRNTVMTLNTYIVSHSRCMTYFTFKSTLIQSCSAFAGPTAIHWINEVIEVDNELLDMFKGQIQGLTERGVDFNRGKCMKEAYMWQERTRRWRSCGMISGKIQECRFAAEGSRCSWWFRYEIFAITLQMRVLGVPWSIKMTSFDAIIIIVNRTIILLLTTAESSSTTTPFDIADDDIDRDVVVSPPVDDQKRWRCLWWSCSIISSVIAIIAMLESVDDSIVFQR